MGILSRFSEIMKANINALLDKCEDPAKMIDQTLRNLREDLAEVKEETAEVMASEKKAKRKLDECLADIEKVTAAAKNALVAQNEEDAKKLINKKQQLEANLVDLQKTYDLNNANADKMKQLYEKLVSDIELLESKSDSIKAKVATAKAQEKINDLTSSTKAQSSLDAFKRMEEKADKMLDEAMSKEELDLNVDTTENLLDKYSGNAASVDEELAKMKAELGL